MELKELTFREQYIDEKPIDNCFRGISIYTKEEIYLGRIEYNEDTHPVTEKEENDNEFWVKFPRKTLTIYLDGLLPMLIDGEFLCSNRRFLLEDKELAKKEVYKTVEKFVKIFIK